MAMNQVVDAYKQNEINYVEGINSSWASRDLVRHCNRRNRKINKKTSKD